MNRKDGHLNNTRHGMSGSQDGLYAMRDVYQQTKEVEDLFNSMCSFFCVSIVMLLSLFTLVSLLSLLSFHGVPRYYTKNPSIFLATHGL